ncbi:uncharacterized protein LOC123308933 [Coccinella septempunctata]|uniref:uncharacterized protein LOC123308933 n=1 Tax=Coccinella septempunctata TaxID=41139 RepID=UPI001D066B0C|nr:uncharacterized protein LOC123308933 [Coccinella septempunctata]
MERSKSFVLDKGTQVYPRDLIKDDREICCANATCSMRIPYGTNLPGLSESELPFSPPKLFTSDDMTMSESLRDDTYGYDENAKASIKNVIPLQNDGFESKKLNILETQIAETNIESDNIHIKDTAENIPNPKNAVLLKTSDKYEEDGLRNREEIQVKIVSPLERTAPDAKKYDSETTTNEESIAEAMRSFGSEDEILAGVENISMNDEKIVKKEISSLTSESFTSSLGGVSTSIGCSNIIVEGTVNDVFIRKNPIWKYDGIDKRNDFRTVRVSTEKVVPNTFDASESDSFSPEPPGTSFWTHKLSDFSNRLSDAMPIKKRQSVNDECLSGSYRRVSEMSDILSVDTMVFPGDFTPPPLITRNRIITFMIERKHYIYEEMKIFKNHLKEESLFVSSLFVFLMYYIFYFICYCGIIEKCSCSECSMY